MVFDAFIEWENDLALEVLGPILGNLHRGSRRTASHFIISLLIAQNFKYGSWCFL